MFRLISGSFDNYFTNKMAILTFSFNSNSFFVFHNFPFILLEFNFSGTIYKIFDNQYNIHEPNGEQIKLPYVDYDKNDEFQFSIVLDSKFFNGIIVVNEAYKALLQELEKYKEYRGIL